MTVVVDNQMFREGRVPPVSASVMSNRCQCTQCIGIFDLPVLIVTLTVVLTLIL